MYIKHKRYIYTLDICIYVFTLDTYIYITMLYYLHYQVFLRFFPIFLIIYRVVENLEICLLKLFRIEELLAPR